MDSSKYLDNSNGKNNKIFQSDFALLGRLKVNMANIYFKQKNYPKAIKFYRMALDQISNAHKELRIKIMQNIGVVFVRLGQYSDAITSFEHIMTESPNIKTGFNLILCYYAVGDRERMKKAFQKLISVPLGIDDEDKYIPASVSYRNACKRTRFGSLYSRNLQKCVQTC